MKPELQSVVPPAIASLLERARQRFRMATMKNQNDDAGIMRDLLAQDGLDIHGRPFGQSEGLPEAATLRVQPIRPCVAQAQSVAGPEVLFSMAFNYRDNHGQLTQRLVSVWVSDAEYFAGHCHLRDAHRLFSWDSVEGQVRLADTGELADVEEIRRRFA